MPIHTMTPTEHFLADHWIETRLVGDLDMLPPQGHVAARVFMKNVTTQAASVRQYEAKGYDVADEARWFADAVEAHAENVDENVLAMAINLARAAVRAASPLEV